nr:MAG TPA: hypothetical protein [Caudoviricetes sp.]
MNYLQTGERNQERKVRTRKREKKIRPRFAAGHASSSRQMKKTP